MQAVVDFLTLDREIGLPDLANLIFLVYCYVFYRYLGPNATGMAILDVGLFSGFEATKSDLEKVSTLFPT